jgi:ankyrin repeat protein
MLLTHGGASYAVNAPHPTTLHTVLHDSAANGHLDVVGLLLDAGALLDSQDRYKYTPLSHACFWGHHEVAALLLNHGACPVTRGGDKGSTPLHMAVAGGCTTTVRTLLRSADVKRHIDDVDGDWRSAMHIAARGGQRNVVQDLLQAGASTYGWRRWGVKDARIVAMLQGADRDECYYFNKVDDYDQEMLYHDEDSFCYDD